MGRITEELLRKRAEHNDGILPDLEEISLHQEEIEKIENLETCCRHIKILLIQGNAIMKMENISKLKELEYLNLSLNNIRKIENIAGCESLKKLDMTLNFVDCDHFKDSILNLKKNDFLEDLYLLGNPCADFEGYRQFVIANLPQLKQLDGNIITPQEFILSQQQAEHWEQQLKIKAEEVRADKEYKEKTGFVPSETSHSVETRLTMAREQGAQKLEKENNEKRRMGTEKKEPKKIPEVMNKQGDIRQCNEGKYKFLLDCTTDRYNIVFELEIPKHMGTDLIDVDVNPLYVRVVCHEKLTQLKLSEEIDVSGTIVQRSKTTGFLKITMPKMKYLNENQNTNSSKAVQYSTDADRNQRSRHGRNKGDEKPGLCDMPLVKHDDEVGKNAYSVNTSTTEQIKSSNFKDKFLISGNTNYKSNLTNGNKENHNVNKGGNGTIEESIDDNQETTDIDADAKERKKQAALSLLEMHRDPICRGA